MKRLLAVLFLSEWFAFSACLPAYQYFFINMPLTWTEAQTYCRQEHMDLVTIESAADVDQLVELLSFAGLSSDVWLGLFSEIQWKWSDGFTENQTGFTDWKTSYNEPNFADADQFCVVFDSDGKWWDDFCAVRYPFICYNGSQLYPKFVFVNESMSWLSAQTFCRENYIDLVTVRNTADNQIAQSLVPKNDVTWIGLYRDPDFYWSNGNSFLFSNWYAGYNDLGSMTVICGVTSMMQSGKWSFKSCETRLPFVCYGPCCESNQVVKLRLKSESSVDLNNPVLKTGLLEKLQENLKENNVSGVTLKWRNQFDENVFQKETNQNKTDL